VHAFWKPARVVPVVLAVLLGACRDHGGDPDLSARLATFVAKGEGTVVDMRVVAPFSWERVWIFGPRTQQLEIERKMRFLWPDAAKTGIANRDDASLVVFTIGSKVARYMLHPLTQGDFSKLDRNGIVPPEAVFRVHLADGRPLLLFAAAAP
jgi:hypothetical protein